MTELIVGSVLRASYPFVWEKYQEMDEDGFHEIKSWKPGVRFEDRYVPPDDVKADAIADGVGEIMLTVVSVHKPGRYPTRVFFTRRWLPPTGGEFGNTACRCVTLEKFRRLAKGYAYPFIVRAEEKAA